MAYGAYRKHYNLNMMSLIRRRIAIHRRMIKLNINVTWHKDKMKQDYKRYWSYWKEFRTL